MYELPKIRMVPKCHAPSIGLRSPVWAKKISKIIKIGGNLTKFWQKQICLVFLGHGVVVKFRNLTSNVGSQHFKYKIYHNTTMEMSLNRIWFYHIYHCMSCSFKDSITEDESWMRARYQRHKRSEISTIPEGPSALTNNEIMRNEWRWTNDDRQMMTMTELRNKPNYIAFKQNSQFSPQINSLKIPKPNINKNYKHYMKTPKSEYNIWYTNMKSKWQGGPILNAVAVHHSKLSRNCTNLHQVSLTPPKKEVMFLVRSVCLSVCLSVGLLANLWTDFDEIFWRGRAWLKDQVIQFWWQSGSRFGYGSPKSEIRILRIGGGLCSLSTSRFYCY